MKNTTRLTFFLFAALLAQPCAAAPGEWGFTGSLNTGRLDHTATLLPDGTVLVAGGISSSGATATAELYDPASGGWTATGSLNTARFFHTATLLADGKVLVTGGIANFDEQSSAELYDPASRTWSFTGNLHFPRQKHTATLLVDGTVLVAGGIVDSRSLDTCEVYNPATGTFALTDKLNSTRYHHTATLLSDGRVLVAGGSNGGYPTKVEIYDPTIARWIPSGALNHGRSRHTATLLPDGRVLVAGGSMNGSDLQNSAELFDPATGLSSYTGEMSVARDRHTATLLRDGTVLAAGGYGNDASGSPIRLASSEIYDPASGTWTPTGSLNFTRAEHTATLLPDGMVLAAGTDPDDTMSAELYDPGMAVTATMASGRGSIAGQGDTATFTLRASLAGDRPNGSVTFRDAAAAISLAKAKVRTLTFDGNNADLGGVARMGDGTRVTYSVSVTDNGDGSTDTFTISVSNGYSAGGTLTSGDISIQ